MTLVSPQQVSDATIADASDVNTPVNQLAAVINGGIENDNISSTAAITGSKLANASLDLGTKVSTWDGWVGVSDTWTYATATTITVPSDATGKYSVGDKIKLVQSATTKYFYIVGVSATTLTIFGGSDYTFTNNAISSIYYSKVLTPLSFPQRFNWTPVWTAQGSNPAIVNGTISGRMSLTGKMCNFTTNIIMGSSTTYGTGDWLFSLPITAYNETGFINANGGGIGVAAITDQGSSAYVGAVETFDTTRYQVQRSASNGFLSSTVPHTWANIDQLRMSATYEIA